MTNETPNTAQEDVRSIGQSIHETELHIYAARQAIVTLRAQEPVNLVAIEGLKGMAREKHHQRHQQAHLLAAAKQAALDSDPWPFHGVSTW